MSGFEADWLALRAGADARARDQGLALDHAAARDIHQDRTALHGGDRALIDAMAGALVQGQAEDDKIGLAEGPVKPLEIGDPIDMVGRRRVGAHPDHTHPHGRPTACNRPAGPPQADHRHATPVDRFDHARDPAPFALPRP